MVRGWTTINRLLDWILSSSASRISLGCTTFLYFANLFEKPNGIEKKLFRGREALRSATISFLPPTIKLRQGNVITHHSVHGGGDLPPLRQIPPEQTPPWANTPSGQTLPLGRHPPMQTPHPLGRHPLHSACWEIRATSGRYASYWNAYLFCPKFSKFHSRKKCTRRTINCRVCADRSVKISQNSSNATMTFKWLLIHYFHRSCLLFSLSFVYCQ